MIDDEIGRCNLLVNNAGVLRDKSLVRSDKATGKGVKNMTKKVSPSSSSSVSVYLVSPIW
jgi:hypothetical protein